jgi:hypothetical protein
VPSDSAFQARDRSAVGHAAADARAGEPGDGGSAVVVAAGAALGEGHAAEFGAPNDAGFLEQAARFEIGEAGPAIG